MILDPPVSGQRFFAPEVVQTSAMDCGPAALKSLLEGFGIPVSYGRLREACQTDVDGTSIDTLEDIAVQLGLRAEQVMLPADHLFLPEAQALPAIVVVRLPNGLTHFLVVWSRVGNFLQIMDPATGRRWPSWQRFIDELYIHTFPVPAAAWREWAGSEGLYKPLQRRLSDLKIEEPQIQALWDNATQDPGWRSLATLDAAARMVASLVRSGGLTAGESAGRVLEQFYQLNLQNATPAAQATGVADTAPDPGQHGYQIPASYWSVLPFEEAGVGPQEETLLLRGAVLVRILGRREQVDLDLQPEDGSTTTHQLPPDLAAALSEPTYRPEREVWKALRQDGLLTPGIAITAVLLATFAVMVEALLLQGVIQISQSLTLFSQRLWAAIVLLGFVLGALLLEFPISSTVLRMGRRLETRLRITLLEKVARLGDRYFHSRLTSDMTQRAHDLRSLRFLPNLALNLLRTGAQLILTTLGVIWLDPVSAPLAITGTAFFIGLSFLTQPLMSERDLRLRTHVGALSRFYLDALLGLVPVKTHGAERAMRRQYEGQLLEWIRSGREFYTLMTAVQAAGAILYSGFALAIVLNYISKGGEANEILLLFYWTLSLPTLGQSLASQVQQYPMLRNQMLRLLEPLSAPDEEAAWAPEHESNQQTAAHSPAEAEVQPAGFELRDVWVQAGGHAILRDINLQVRPGEHVAIVGRSGAGKSSLVGLLLGWHRPAQGQILVDGVPLDGARIQTLREDTAWVDPAVQLWNRSLYENLRYGMEHGNGQPLSETIELANLFDVMERLPEGLKTSLGEGGGLVSGGEGQRVRLARGLLRSDVRLVILDEPFRGLDRQQRRQLLKRARQHWQQATLLCITHDVSETLGFERVVVIEDGQIVEQGAPNELARQPDSRYSVLLSAEEEVRRSLWSGAAWRRLWIQDGKVQPRSDENEPETQAPA